MIYTLVNYRKSNENIAVCFYFQSLQFPSNASMQKIFLTLVIPRINLNLCLPGQSRGQLDLIHASKAQLAILGRRHTQERLDIQLELLVTDFLAKLIDILFGHVIIPAHLAVGNLN